MFNDTYIFPMSFYSIWYMNVLRCYSLIFKITWLATVDIRKWYIIPLIHVPLPKRNINTKKKIIEETHVNLKRQRFSVKQFFISRDIFWKSCSIQCTYFEFQNCKTQEFLTETNMFVRTVSGFYYYKFRTVPDLIKTLSDIQLTNRYRNMAHYSIDQSKTDSRTNFIQNKEKWFNCQYRQQFTRIHMQIVKRQL